MKYLKDVFSWNKCMVRARKYLAIHLPLWPIRSSTEL